MRYDVVNRYDKPLSTEAMNRIDYLTKAEGQKGNRGVAG